MNILMNTLLCILQFTVSRIQGLCWNFWWMALRWGQRWNTPLVPSYKAPGSSLFKDLNAKNRWNWICGILRWFGVMIEDGWWCSAGTGFIKIKRALNLIYGICINTLSKKALLTSIPRFSIFCLFGGENGHFSRECCFMGGSSRQTLALFPASLA